MEIKLRRPTFGLDLDMVMFNFVMNALPDNIFCSYLRARLARIFGLKCGEDCQIRKNIFFEGHRKIVLGNRVCLNRQSYLDAGGGIFIGDNVRFGPQTMLIAGSHEIGRASMRAGELLSGNIRIEDGCWIGARVTVTAGVTIGKGSVVSAGAVVHRTMPPNYLIAGNPARPVSLLDRPREDDEEPAEFRSRTKKPLAFDK